MDAVFAYLDADFLDFVVSMVGLAPADLVLAGVVTLLWWFLGWFVRLMLQAA